MNNNEIVRFKKRHKGDIKRLIKIVSSEDKLKKSIQLRLSVFLAILLLIFVDYKNVDVLKLLNNISTITLSIMPSIIGFNLGAYVLFVGLSSSNFSSDLSDDYDENNYSTYQHISSIFAWSILIQSITLISCYITSIIISMEIKINCSCCINYMVLLILSILSLYAILLVYRTIMNVFSLGQVIHFFSVLNKIENNNE